MLRPLIVFGTRPEAIKLASLIRDCRAHPEMAPMVCNTGQHRELVDPIIEYFALAPDYALDVMRPGQSLAALTSRLLEALDMLLGKGEFDCVIAQGDTTTVLAAGMTAFYRDLPLVHVEAGLRTGNLHAPWPEEYNRRVVSLSAELHCAPTQWAADNLMLERVDPSKIVVTGNTVVDALQWSIARERHSEVWQRKYPMLAAGRELVLVTGHRRENLDGGLDSICNALVRIARARPEVAVVFPVHLNPKVRATVEARLSGIDNIYLVPAAQYPEFVWLMDRATVILTDSGGVQEEAPSFGCKVLVTREATERPEALECGAAMLVGTNEERIVLELQEVLDVVRQSGQGKALVAKNPFGDGQASQRIVAAMEALIARQMDALEQALR